MMPKMYYPIPMNYDGNYHLILRDTPNTDYRRTIQHGAGALTALYRQVWAGIFVGEVCLTSGRCISILPETCVPCVMNNFIFHANTEIPSVENYKAFFFVTDCICCCTPYFFSPDLFIANCQFKEIT